jgi:hypothetical protein
MSSTQESNVILFTVKEKTETGENKKAFVRRTEVSLSFAGKF